MGRSKTGARTLLAACVLAVMLALPAAAGALTISLPPLLNITIGSSAPPPAQPVITAHRGGAILNGVPTYAENTLPGFHAAALRGDVVEFDVHVTKDGVPIVVHDDTLDRVTACKNKGAIHTLTFAQVQACPVIYLGRYGEKPQLPAVYAPTPVPIPTLAQVLAQAKADGATISPEIKSIPPTTYDAILASDFDPTGQVAVTIAKALAASGIPQNKIILQSFWPLNLDAARPYLPNAQYSFLTLAPLNGVGPAYAALGNFAWVSPDFSSGVDATYMLMAHLLNRKVTVYTVNTASRVRAARDLGVDAIITDDPVMARNAL
jgi:glycerophosphoryl diester phosphodiesterase